MPHPRPSITVRQVPHFCIAFWPTARLCGLWLLVFIKRRRLPAAHAAGAAFRYPALWPQASSCEGGGADLIGGTVGAPAAGPPTLDLSTVFCSPTTCLFFILGKATWRELLVGDVDNLAKLVLAWVCGVLKIDLRDRLRVGAGQIARCRGTDCTWITLPAAAFPYDSDSPRRGTDYTWTTLLNHRVVRAARPSKRIEARRGRDAAGGSMRSTKAWPQRSWGEPNELVFGGATEARNPPWPPPNASPNCPATRPART